MSNSIELGCQVCHLVDYLMMLPASFAGDDWLKAFNRLSLPVMETIHISRASLADLNALQAIGKQTFSETFGATNSEANMQAYLADSFSEEKLTAELNSEASAFYFAKLDCEVLGYLKLNFAQAQTEMKDTQSLEIERIYVLQAYHGKKVGQLLFQKAMEVAQQSGVNYVWLGVWEENTRAIAFYKKNGFVEFDQHVFKLGNDEQTDIMMRLSL